MNGRLDVSWVAALACAACAACADQTAPRPKARAPAGEGGGSAIASAGIAGAAGAAGREPAQCDGDVRDVRNAPSGVICQGAQLEAMQRAGLGEPRAFFSKVVSRELTRPMLAGAPYAYSIDLVNLGDTPNHVELWGADAECGTKLERLDAQSAPGGVVCSSLHPSAAHTHLIVVLRSNGAYAEGTQTICPSGACLGTTGTAEEWPGKSQPFCNPDLPERCEACLVQDGCDAPTYTDHGDGTVSSSCCGLTWQQGLSRERLTHVEALVYCASLPLAGGGFRLPTLGEALSLVDTSMSPTIDVAAFPGSSASDELWTATETGFFDYVETVELAGGTSNGRQPELTFDVRCVR